MTYEFSIKTFDELTTVDLYHILKARSQVFVVEQNCAYQDMDETDFDCLHLIAHQNQALAGYCRIIPPEFNKLKSNLSSSISVDAPSIKTTNTAMPAIGRVLVLAEHRGDGLARQIMTQAIACCRKKYGKKTPIIISAQTYLLGFYESLGFVPEGDRYFEDNIEHVKMVLHVAKKTRVRKERTYSDSTTTSKVLSGLLFILAALFILGLLYLMI